MSESAPTLEYSTEQRRPWWRRRRSLYIALTILLLAAGYYFHQPVIRRGKQLYWYHQCARFTAPASQPATMPSTSSQAQRDPNYYSVVYTSNSRSTSHLYFVPKCWQELMRGVGVSYLSNTYFLHELRTPSGKRRLVHVTCFNVNAFTLPSDLLSSVIEPPTLFSPLRIIQQSSGIHLYSGPWAPATLRYGQIDPADPSHFTFEVEVDRSYTNFDRFPSGKGIIDAYLGDDDRVTFKLRVATTQQD